MTRPVALLRSVAIAAAAVLLASPASAQPAPAPAPDGTIDLTGRSIAAGLGYTWGGGTLHYMGGTHPLSIKGVSIIDVGISKFSARGDVFHLSRLTDINGVYHAVSAGAAVAGGGSVASMGNDKGVQIKLVSSTAGLQFKLAPEGVTIRLK